MLFAVTINCLNRNGFFNDTDALQRCVQILKNYGCEISDLHYELQPFGMHNLHLHTAIASNKPIPLKDIYKKISKEGCHSKITQILSSGDYAIWRNYCRKSSYDIAYEYAESVRANNKDNMIERCNETRAHMRSPLPQKI